MTLRALINPNAIPRELWAYHQFAPWKYVDRGRPKPDKVLVNARTLGNGGSTWPNTWCDILTAVAAYKAHEWLAGIGFVLSQHDPYTMIDLDNCVIDGIVSQFASDIVDRLDTYAEFSPSGKGLRLFVYCEAQPPTLKRSEIEVYSRERFATLTGDAYRLRSIIKVESLQWLYDRFPIHDKGADRDKPTASLSERAAIPQDDAELWRRICTVNSLARELYNGNLTNINKKADGTSDESRAVIILLNSLAKWTNGDASRMRRMMEQTALDKTKWKTNRKGQDWLTGRINDAIDYMSGR